GVEDAPVGRAARDEGLGDRRDELVRDALCVGVRQRRRRRSRPHAAGVWAGVAVANALVVARRRERDHGLAVDERLKRRLLALERLLEDDGAAVERRGGERDGRVVERARDEDALARGETVRL